MTQKFYLRAALAPAFPTAGEKSSVLPTRTLGANNATGDDEKHFMDSVKGSGQTSISKAADNTTSARQQYLARFSSDGLKAGTYGSGTWTLGVAMNESNSNANSFLVLSVYFWRPSNNSVVGYVYDSATQLGSEWAAVENGRVVTFTGSNVTIQDKDIIVIEIWRDSASQAMSGTYAQIVYFDGTTDPVNLTNTSDAASYLNAPADIPEFPVLKFLNETEQISEAKLTIRKRLKAIAETVQISEARRTIRKRLKPISETVQISEAKLTIRKRIKQILETIQISESKIIHRSLVRIKNETQQIIESLLIHRALTKLKAETVQISESIRSIRGRIKQILETIQIQESNLIHRGLSKLVNETEQIVEAIRTIRGRIKRIAEKINLFMDKSSSDVLNVTPNNSTDFGPYPYNGVSYIPAKNHKVTRARIQIKRNNINQLGILHAYIFKNPTGSNLNLVETSTNGIDLSTLSLGSAYDVDFFFDGIGDYDNELIAVAISRNDYDASSGFIELKFYTPAPAGFTGLVFAGGTWQNGVLCFEIITDTYQFPIIHRGLARIINEFENIVEEIIKKIEASHNVFKMINEFVEVSESNLFVRSLARLKNEIVNISESRLIHRGLVKLKNETEEIPESISFVERVKMLINETLEIDELVRTIRGRLARVNESESIQESNIIQRGLIRLKNEIMSIQEVKLIHRGLSRIKNETERIQEAELISRGIAKIKNEIINIIKYVFKEILVPKGIKIQADFQNPKENPTESGSIMADFYNPKESIDADFETY